MELKGLIKMGIVCRDDFNSVAAKDGTLGREELAAMLALQLAKQPSIKQVDTLFKYLTHGSQRIGFEAYMDWVSVDWLSDGGVLPCVADEMIQSVSANEVTEVLHTTTIYLRRPRLIPQEQAKELLLEWGVVPPGWLKGPETDKAAEGLRVAFDLFDQAMPFANCSTIKIDEVVSWLLSTQRLDCFMTKADKIEAGWAERKGFVQKKLIKWLANGRSDHASVLDSHDNQSITFTDWLDLLSAEPFNAIVPAEHSLAFPSMVHVLEPLTVLHRNSLLIFSKDSLVNSQINAILDMALLWPWSECTIRILEDTLMIVPVPENEGDAKQRRASCGFSDPMIVPLRGLQSEVVGDVLVFKPLGKGPAGVRQKIVLSVHLPSDSGSPFSASKNQTVQSAVVDKGHQSNEIRWKTMGFFGELPEPQLPKRLDYFALFEYYDKGSKGILDLTDLEDLLHHVRNAEIQTQIFSNWGCGQVGTIENCKEAYRVLVGDSNTALRITKSLQCGIGVTLWMFTTQFKRLLYPAHRDKPPVSVPKVVLVADPGPDPDDVKVIMIAAAQHRAQEIEIVGILANGGHLAKERAALARVVLQQFGQEECIPVGVGCPGEKRDAEGYEFAISGWAEAMEVEEPAGQQLFLQILQNAEEHSIIVQIQAGFMDVAQIIESHPDLFEEKVVWVSIMGGLKHEDGEWVADSAQNNVFDKAASAQVYRFCLQRCVPMNVISRDAVPMIPMQLARSFHQEQPDNVLFKYLYQVQTEGLVGLWRKVCRGQVPKRCNKKWYFSTFCGMPAEGYEENYGTTSMLGQPAGQPVTYGFLPSEDNHAEFGEFFDIAPMLNGTVKPYDVCCFMLNLPISCKAFDFPSARVTVDGDNGSMSHHFFLTSELMASQARTVDLLHEVYTGISGLHFVELGAQQLQLQRTLSCNVTTAGHDLNVLNHEVLRMLNSEWPQQKNTSLLDTWKRRDKLMQSIGPAMVLMDPLDIQALGRIPKQDEGHTICLAEAAGRAANDGLRFFIEMFSHRWCHRDQPDDNSNSKAKALVEWAKYRKACGLRSFFWIDYSCVNQNFITPGVTMLPLYVASCNNIAFCAPSQDYVREGFQFSGNKDQAPISDGKVKLQDPVEGALSCLEDGALIASYAQIAINQWQHCWKEGLHVLVKDKLDRVDQLVWGETEVRSRQF